MLMGLTVSASTIVLPQASFLRFISAFSASKWLGSWSFLRYNSQWITWLVILSLLLLFLFALLTHDWQISRRNLLCATRKLHIWLSYLLENSMHTMCSNGIKIEAQKRVSMLQAASNLQGTFSRHSCLNESWSVVSSWSNYMCCRHLSRKANIHLII